MQALDDLALPCGLVDLDLEAEIGRPLGDDFIDLRKGLVTVDRRLPRAQPVEVRSVDHQDFHAATFLSTDTICSSLAPTPVRGDPGASSNTNRRFPRCFLSFFKALITA